MMPYSLKGDTLSGQPSILGILVIVTNIIKLFNFVTNTTISILCFLHMEEGNKEPWKIFIDPVSGSVQPTDFISLIANNNKSVLFEMLRAFCFNSSILLYSVMWFIFLIDLTNFFRNFCFYISFLLLFAIHYSIF